MDSAQHMVQRDLSPFVVPGMYCIKLIINYWQAWVQIPNSLSIQMLKISGKYDIWNDFLNGSASPSFQHVAKTLKVAEVNSKEEVASWIFIFNVIHLQSTDEYWDIVRNDIYPKGNTFYNS